MKPVIKLSDKEPSRKDIGLQNRSVLVRSNWMSHWKSPLLLLKLSSNSRSALQIKNLLYLISVGKRHTKLPVSPDGLMNQVANCRATNTTTESQTTNDQPQRRIRPLLRSADTINPRTATVMSASVVFETSNLLATFFVETTPATTTAAFRSVLKCRTKSRTENARTNSFFSFFVSSNY